MMKAARVSAARVVVATTTEGGSLYTLEPLDRRNCERERMEKPPSFPPCECVFRRLFLSLAERERENPPMEKRKWEAL